MWKCEHRRNQCSPSCEIIFPPLHLCCMRPTGCACSMLTLSFYLTLCTFLIGHISASTRFSCHRRDIQVSISIKTRTVKIVSKKFMRVDGVAWNGSVLILRPLNDVKCVWQTRVSAALPSHMLNVYSHYFIAASTNVRQLHTLSIELHDASWCVMLMTWRRKQNEFTALKFKWHLALIYDFC